MHPGPGDFFQKFRRKTDRVYQDKREQLRCFHSSLATAQCPQSDKRVPERPVGPSSPFRRVPTTPENLTEGTPPVPLQHRTRPSSALPLPSSTTRTRGSSPSFQTEQKTREKIVLPVRTGEISPRAENSRESDSLVSLYTHTLSFPLVGSQSGAVTQEPSD